ncbi:hypothetical protein F2P81_008466 [Scophthalmus maximus]|uniref:Uncharacterized protein n=1 Tax=Scophthalmus maximus TaxID=52904 RepID=A0A6A4TBD8_SCOMX|nr:hypothetical protein F2P81_008466 [Scophthalmus maximus]
MPSATVEYGTTNLSKKKSRFGLVIHGGSNVSSGIWLINERVLFDAVIPRPSAPEEDDDDDDEAACLFS